MDFARSKSQWTYTSEIIAAIYNTVRDSKTRAPFTGDDFNPHVIAEKKKRGPSIRDFASCIPDPKARARALQKLSERERKLDGS